MSHIFGTRAFYHRKVMFAMLPDRRSLDSSTAISFRAPLRGSNEDAGWRSFNSRVPTSLTPHYRCWVRPTRIVSLIHLPKHS
jgi:hypothetical protein